MKEIDNNKIEPVDFINGVLILNCLSILAGKLLSQTEFSGISDGFFIIMICVINPLLIFSRNGWDESHAAKLGYAIGRTLSSKKVTATGMIFLIAAAMLALAVSIGS